MICFCATPLVIARTVVRRMIPGMSSRRARRDIAVVLLRAVRSTCWPSTPICANGAVEVSGLMIGNDSGVITTLFEIGNGSGTRIESRAGARPLWTTMRMSLSSDLPGLSRLTSACSSSGVFGRNSAALR
ncbi:hypothetical protein D3C81_1524910 [compost metagenome]